MTEEWQSQNFRENVRFQIQEMLPQHGLKPSENATVMESHIFRKAQNKDEYLELVAKLSLYYQSISQLKSEQLQPQQLK